MRAKTINKQIEEASFVHDIDRFSKVDHCLLCGKKMSSACNSHVVPQFILRGIAENGQVSYGYVFHKRTIKGLEKTTGIKNAYPFRLICNECDKKTFAYYEDPKNLERFDVLDVDTKKIMLCEMAIKAHLSHIYMKYRRIVALDASTGGLLGVLEKEGRAVFAERTDIEEHVSYIDKLRKFAKSNKNPFVILFDKELDYQTRLATQTVLHFNYDLGGKPIYDTNVVIGAKPCRYFYLMVLPYNGKTRVLFYIEKKGLEDVQAVVDQFGALSDDDKLHFLFVSLIIHDQQFHMSPSFAENIVKKDKKLSKLYVDTEKHLDHQSKIKNFRKYTNYLLREFNQ